MIRYPDERYFTAARLCLATQPALDVFTIVERPQELGHNLGLRPTLGGNYETKTKRPLI
jgi:hypothetical protein